MKNKLHKFQVVDDTVMNISRKKVGKTYRYFDEQGSPITDKIKLQRFRKLVIPPMWSEVQICEWDDGHIQAIGRDKKGRKQYIYHTEWEKQRQEEKFAKMEDFGKKISSMRKVCLENLKMKKWTKEKVMSLIILILDETGVRIGNQEYVDKNGTYGLTTLRRKHLKIDETGGITFDYQGKSGIQRTVEIDNVELSRMIKKSAELPGYELFRFKLKDGSWENIDSDDINYYIHQYMGEAFSSKDFRTWTASRLAIELYPTAIRLKSNSPRKKFTNILLRLVADELGNTPTVCKSYYVHPKVLHEISNQSLPNEEDLETHEIFDFKLSASERKLMQIIGK